MLAELAELAELESLRTRERLRTQALHEVAEVMDELAPLGYGDYASYRAGVQLVLDVLAHVETRAREGAARMSSLTDLAHAAQTTPPTDAAAALALAEDACRALAAMTDRDRCDTQAVHRDVDRLFGSIHRAIDAEWHAAPPTPINPHAGSAAAHLPVLTFRHVASRLCPVCVGVPTDCVCTRPTRGVVTR